MRYPLALLVFALSLTQSSSRAQSFPLPDAPAPTSPILLAASLPPGTLFYSSSAAQTDSSFEPVSDPDPSSDPVGQNLAILPPTPAHKPNRAVPQDAQGNPIPLDRQEPARILGFMPNFRSVSAGATAPPPGWKYNLSIADHQAFDYSSFLLLGLTSIVAEGFNQHPSLGKGVPGLYAYTWRGLIDKTDGTYLSAFFLPSLLHEDTRFYPLGSGHTILKRTLYVISRQAVARDYDGNPTPNIANLGGKVVTQIISQYYYPDGTSGFPVLATKFGYSVMRDVGFSAIREFYPDVAAHYIRRHREKVARQAALDAHPATTP